MTNPNSDYQEAIIEAIKTLSDSEHPIFGSALRMLMSEEWKEINEAFDEGQNYTFSLAQMEDTSDQNVLTLVEVIKNLRTAVLTLQNLNGIKDEELNF